LGVILLDFHSYIYHYTLVMVDEGTALFPQHEDDIGSVDLLDAGPGSPFTDDIAVPDDDNLANIFDEHNLPSLNSPLTSPTRSTNSSVSVDVEPGAETPPRRNSDNAAQLGLPANELEEADWRNDATDLRSRKEILLQIVKILHARKANPTTNWLKSLPYKARKLEEQLYRGAPSIEDYSDKRTLKHRLKRVAHDIKSRHRARLNGSPTKSPDESKSSSARSSDSDSQSRESLVDEQMRPPKASAGSLHAAGLASLQSLLSEQQTTPSHHPSLSHVTPSNIASFRQTMMTPEEHRVGRCPSSSIITPSNSVQPSIGSELAALQAMQSNLQRSRQQHRSSINGRTNADIAALLGSTDGNIHPARISNHGVRGRHSLQPNAIDHHFQQQQQQRRLSSGRQETIQEQQAVNEKLQQQILENIRQQQILMRELMVGSNSTSSLRGANNAGHRSSAMPTRLSGATSSIGPNNSTASQFSQSMLLNSNKANPLLGGGSHRQLPLDLLQQSLMRNNSGMMQQQQQQQQRRNSNGMHPSVPPPRRNSFLNGLQDHLSPNTFNW
jgi:hypothetical protein